ncbi:MAG: winged helix DNA-binding domain-containing protein [Acidimicrobiia bacterium]|nr:winged helix DNA-binding domain-containing protein [Acidimicrobiia bacterium]
MAMVLTAGQALANAIDRHHLATPGRSIESVAEELVGLHNTSQVSPYLSVRARVSEFERAGLDTLMWEQWRLVRFRAMRLTMFVFPLDLLEVAAAAARHITEPLAARWLRDSGLTEQDLRLLSDAVVEALADGPLTSRQLRQALEVAQSVDLPGVVGRLCDVGRVVGGAPPRQWRSGIRQYHRWGDVLPDVDLHKWDEDAAIAELVGRYVRAYGPVTLSDIAWWTGFTKTRCRKALTTFEGSLEEVTVEGWPGPLIRFRDDNTTVVDSSSVAALPILDPYVQGYRDRERLLGDEHHGYVWDAGGNGTATLVRLGRVIGVWQPIDKPASIRYHLFADDPTAADLSEAALDEVARIYFDTSVDLVEIDTMKPLRGPEGNRSAMHPLDSQLHRATLRGS